MAPEKGIFPFEIGPAFVKHQLNAKKMTGSLAMATPKARQVQLRK
jgi:hypothetical protein